MLFAFIHSFIAVLSATQRAPKTGEIQCPESLPLFSLRKGSFSRLAVKKAENPLR